MFNMNFRSILMQDVAKFATILARKTCRRATDNNDPEEQHESRFVYQSHITKNIDNTNHQMNNKLTKPIIATYSRESSHMKIYVANMDKKKIEKDGSCNITYLDFSEIMNFNKKYVRPIRFFDNLRIVSITNAGLLRVPKVIQKLNESIEYLDLSGNFIQEIPNVKWGHLKGLNLSNNRLKRWPEIIKPKRIPKLEFLDLSYNDFVAGIPSNLFFEQLVHLNLSHCCLMRFPDFICHQLSLKSLDISGNDEMEGFTYTILTSILSLQYVNISGISVTNTYEDFHFPPSVVVHRNAIGNVPLAKNILYIR